MFKREEGRNERAMEYIGLEAEGRGNWKEERDGRGGQEKAVGKRNKSEQNRMTQSVDGAIVKPTAVCLNFKS